MWRLGSHVASALGLAALDECAEPRRRCVLWIYDSRSSVPTGDPMTSSGRYSGLYIGREGDAAGAIVESRCSKGAYQREPHHTGFQQQCQRALLTQT